MRTFAGTSVRRGQADGFDLDLDALVRARGDLRAGSGSLDRVHIAMRPQAHDLAATLLVDVSLSTDAWVDGQRVLDVEKEALLVLAHGLWGLDCRCGGLRHGLISGRVHEGTTVADHPVRD